MPDAYTTTASVNSVQAAFDLYAYFALRNSLYFDQVADVKPTNQSMRGSSVKFTKYTDLSPATSALNESVDVDARAISDGQVTVTLVEHGDAVIDTEKVRDTSFQDIPRDIANIIGYSAGNSFDQIARDPLTSGTNVLYSGTATARNQITPSSTLTGANVRRVQAKLLGNNAVPWADGFFRAFIHPDVAYDFKSETGEASWNYPHAHADPTNIWRGSIGMWNQFDFLCTPTAFVVADAGSSTTLTDVYQTTFCARQALAKAYAPAVGPMPEIRRGAVVDKLQRFEPIGWYWLGGYARFREECLYRYESASSIGAN